MARNPSLLGKREKGGRDSHWILEKHVSPTSGEEPAGSGGAMAAGGGPAQETGQQDESSIGDGSQGGVFLSQYVCGRVTSW